MTADQLYPDFEEYQFPSSTVSAKLFEWKVPRSDIWLPFVQVSGDWLSEADTLHVKWQTALLSYTISGSGVLLDVTDVRFGEQVLVRFTERSLRTRRLGIAVTSTDRERFQELAPGAVLDDVQKAAVYVAEGLRHRSHDASKPVSEQTVLSTIKPVVPELDLVGFRAYVGGREGNRIALFSISGNYANGGAGKPQASLISWQLERFTDAIQPNAVVVDVRDFSYAYGDDLDLYPNQFFPRGRIAFIVGPQGRGTFDIKAEHAGHSLEECLAKVL